MIVVDGKQVWVVGTLPAVEASGRRGDVYVPLFKFSEGIYLLA